MTIKKSKSNWKTYSKAVPRQMSMILVNPKNSKVVVCGVWQNGSLNMYGLNSQGKGVPVGHTYNLMTGDKWKYFLDVDIEEDL